MIFRSGWMLMVSTNTILVLTMASLLVGCGETRQEQSSADLASKEDNPSLVVEKEREEISSEEPDTETESIAEPPVVFFTTDITAEGLVRIYEQLDWQPTGNVAVKISTGEPPASNYLRQELIGDLVQQVDGTIVECNTAYGGSRGSSAMHRQVAEDHGFTAIADFDLMDEEGEVEWPMSGGSRLDKVIVGSHAENYSDWVILSHFKGHAMERLLERVSLSKYRDNFVLKGGLLVSSLVGVDMRSTMDVDTTVKSLPLVC